MVRHIVKLGCEEEVPVLITRALPGIPLNRNWRCPRDCRRNRACSASRSTGRTGTGTTS
jgi:hypothetical protein